jgi:hypothetical protein
MLKKGFTKPPAADWMKNMGLEPDDWQRRVLESNHPRLLLNCSRQAGKSTVVAMLALSEALYNENYKVIILGPCHRQSKELLKTAYFFYERLGSLAKLRKTQDELELTTGSRLLALPCSGETIRGYSGVNLIIIDEAARVPDDLFHAVSPMLAVSGGKMICLSTPYGKRGYFYEMWSKGGDDWERIEVPVERIKRISASHLERERRTMGESWYRQEYCCSFEALEGPVYPDFARCLVDGPAPAGQAVGGIDFGLRNPFAAIWGVLDRDDVLWITGEHYSREQTLAHHAAHMPRKVMWYADPEGAREVRELLAAGFKIRRGNNDQRPGINAVRARIEDGTLKVVKDSCPNLLAEAGLYRYDPEDKRKSEKPVKEYDHALDALRYLISRVDAYRMRRLRNRDYEKRTLPPESQNDEPAPRATTSKPDSRYPGPPKPRPWLSIHNEALWTRM